jgi:solute carrier family 29 (equilibrative nucleoside transporter) protein 4
MDESSSGGYLLLDREKPKPLSSSSSESQSTSPSDPYNLIYFSLLLAGIAFLLPYNSFVIAVDYFQSRYPSTTIIFDISTIYILMAFITVIMNNVLVEAIPLFWRINFGYGLSFLVLVFVTIVEISAQLGGYKLNLMAVAIVAIGSTVQQSSFYGYTSMLPKRYTHSVMIGESMAGLIVSANRITTKLLFPNDEKFNTILFFSISIAIVIICGIIHSLILPKTDFIKFYINSCASSASNVMQISQNESLGLKEMFRNNDSEYEGNKFGVLSIDTDDYCKLNSESSGRVSKISGRISKLSLERESNSPIFQRQVSMISRSESTDFVLPFGIDDEELSFEESLKNVELDSLKNNVENSFDDNFYVKIEEKQTFFKRSFKWYAFRVMFKKFFKD